MSHKYKLVLTDEEYETIRFVASRGYCVNLYEALSHENTLCEPVDPGTMYYIPEWLAWPIHTELENNGGHHFGPVSNELTAKLYKFVDQIV